MALAPGFENVDHRPQALADIRQGVVHPRRHFGIDLANDNAIILQRAKLFCEHALGDARHQSP